MNAKTHTYISAERLPGVYDQDWAINDGQLIITPEDPKFWR